MSRFIKRFGTKGIPYQIDIVLFKLQMNVIVPDCQISVTLKRGDHKSELKNPVLLKDKVARFDKQVISVPTKLYWDEKKQEFLSKIAELQINIKHQKTVKTAGKIEFDAAQYATNEILQKKETLPLQKCPDPQAKLYFEIRVHELGDYSHYNKPDEEEEERPNKQKQAASSIRGRDVSPMLPTMDTNSQIKDIALFKDRSVSPINRVESKTVTFGNNQSQLASKQQQFQSSSSSAYNQEPPTSARAFSEFQQQQLQQQQRQLSADANKAFQPAFGAGFNTQTSSNSGNNSNTLKGSQNLTSDLSSQSEMRNLFKQQKEENTTLRTKIQELIIENEGLKSQCDNLKNENQRAKSRITTLESQQAPSIMFPSDMSSKRLAQNDTSSEKEALIVKLNEEIKQLKSLQPKDSRSDDLERQLKELRNTTDQAQSEISLRFEREKSVWEKKVKDLEMSLAEEQQRTKDLQSELNRRQKDVEYYRQLSTKSNKLEGDNEYALSLQKQLQDQAARGQQTESELKSRIKELTEENARTKKDRELELIDLRRAKTEGDHELAKTSREFDALKKDNKELTAKLQQAKIALQSYLNKEGTDTTTKSKELQNKLDDLNNKLVKLSVERGNIEMERDNLKREVRSKEDDAVRLRLTCSGFESQLMQTKQMFSDVVNVIMQSGDRDFIDEVEPYLSDQNGETTAKEDVQSGFLQQQQQQQQSQKNFLSQPANTGNVPFTTNLVYSQTKTNEMNRSNVSADRNMGFNNNNNNQIL